MPSYTMELHKVLESDPAAGEEFNTGGGTSSDNQGAGQNA